MSKYKLSEIVAKFGGELVGDDTTVSGIAPTNLAVDGQITFLSDSKYLSSLANCAASAIIIAQKDAQKSTLAVPFIVCSNPQLYMCRVSQLFNPAKKLTQGINQTVVTGENFQIGDNAAIANYVVIGDNVTIGDNCQIYPHVIIGDNVTIGNNVVIHPNVTIYSNVSIGDDCGFHSGVVLGSDGFGNALDESKQWHKIPQIGGVLVGSRVEIGANTTIDCGTYTPTIIGDGVRIDNLVQIGHNVEIGDNTAIAACAGFAGSTKIGKYCMIGGGAKFNGHIKVADYTVVGGGTDITKSITKPDFYASIYPFSTFKVWARNAVYLKRLNEMYKRLKKVEEQVNK